MRKSFPGPPGITAIAVLPCSTSHQARSHQGKQLYAVPTGRGTPQKGDEAFSRMCGAREGKKILSVIRRTPFMEQPQWVADFDTKLMISTPMASLGTPCSASVRIKLFHHHSIELG
jgi:hypothetical protein